ncbi:hypothetical protein WS62_10140 [Burkholderia sp. ABCPW 14]|nr:hypothetical protein WS62_10140 [Burkholderia sp. ABCPW 14]
MSGRAKSMTPNRTKDDPAVDTERDSLAPASRLLPCATPHRGSHSVYAIFSDAHALYTPNLPVNS